MRYTIKDLPFSIRKISERGDKLVIKLCITRINLLLDKVLQSKIQDILIEFDWLTKKCEDCILRVAWNQQIKGLIDIDELNQITYDIFEFKNEVASEIGKSLEAKHGWQISK